MRAKSLTLVIFLAIGESIQDFKSKGQLKRLVLYNFKKFSQDFNYVYIFSYADEKQKFYGNCEVVPNKLGLHRYLYSLLAPILYARLIKRADIVRGFQLSGGIPAIVAKILFGKKFVINYGYDYFSFAKIERKFFQALFYKLIKWPILLSANAIIVTSLSIKRELEKKNINNKIFLIPNGVDTNIFKPIPKKKGGLLNIAFIGRFEKQKNLFNLICAVKDQKKGISLNFFGDGSLKNKIIKEAKKLKVDLSLQKPVDYYKLPKILGRMDIFALVSEEEGNPKILLEAMACEKAVLASNVRGISEIIKDGKNGLLVNTDQKSISGGITKLLDVTLRKNLGREARKTVLKNFKMSDLLGKETSLLKKIAYSHLR